jgi:hypothetical protein
MLTAIAQDHVPPQSASNASGQHLSLRGTGLPSVPPDVWQAAPHLSSLDLSDNPVGNIALQQHV